MNDSKSKKQVVKQQMQSDEPTSYMLTQFALNMSQGILDALKESGVTKSQILSWN